jgi:hypothetical protein
MARPQEPTVNFAADSMLRLGACRLDISPSRLRNGGRRVGLRRGPGSQIGSLWAELAPRCSVTLQLSVTPAVTGFATDVPLIRRQSFASSCRLSSEP